MTKLTGKQRSLFAEARRRFNCFRKRDNVPLERAWVGLGYPREYRPCVEAGLMRPLSGEKPRILGWYLLTAAGVEVYRQLFADADAPFVTPDYATGDPAPQPQ